MKKLLLAIFFSLGLLGAAQPLYAATSTIQITKPKQTFPAVPSLVATTTANKVILQWGKATTKILFTSYSVFRSDKKGSLGARIAKLPGTLRAYTDTSVKTGKTYYYSVRYERTGVQLANGRQVKVTVPKTNIPAPNTTTTTLQKTTDIETSATTAPAVMPAQTTTELQAPSQSTIQQPTPTQSPNIFSNINPTAPVITDAAASARDVSRVSTLYQLQTALEMYTTDLGSYPAGSGVTLGSGRYSCLNSDGWGSSTDCPYPYMGNIPADPGGSAYVYTQTGSSYTITVTLDGKVNNLSGKIVLSPNGIANAK